jgi:hypothetical protein
MAQIPGLEYALPAHVGSLGFVSFIVAEMGIVSFLLVRVVVDGVPIVIVPGMVFPLVSWFEEGEMGKKQATTNVVACCRDALHGPPTSWVPPGVLHPPFLRQLCISCSHPFEKGRGGYGYVLTCEVGGVSLVERYKRF